METIKIRGKEFKLFPERIDVKKLKYYINNPRIHDLSIENKAKTNEQIDKLMWNAKEQYNETRKLCNKIESDGKVNERLIVDKKNNVLEGNTRLACLRDLIRRSKRKTAQWNKVDIFRIKRPLSESEILEIIGSYHLKGKKTDWTPFQLASYFNDLKIKGLNVEEIAERTGKSESVIRQNIKAYNLIKEERGKSSDFSFYKDIIIKQEAIINRASKETNVSKKQIMKKWKKDYRAGMVQSQFVRQIKEIATNKDSIKELANTKSTISETHKRVKKMDVTLSDNTIKEIADLTNKLKTSVTGGQRQKWKQSKYLKIIDNHVKTLKSLYFDLEIDKKWPK